MNVIAFKGIASLAMGFCIACLLNATSTFGLAY